MKANIEVIEQLEKLHRKQLTFLAEMKQIEQLKPFDFYIRIIDPNLFVLCNSLHEAVKIESRLSTLKSYLNLRGITNYTII